MTLKSRNLTEHGSHEALPGLHFKKALTFQLWGTVSWLSLVVTPSGSATESEQRPLFPGSSQPVTEHSKSTRPGHFCQHRAPPRAVCMLEHPVGLCETSSEVCYSLELFFPSFPWFLLFFHRVRLTLRFSCSLFPLFSTGITLTESLAP